MKVIAGRKKMPAAVMIFGPQGAGKTTAAADWDDDVLVFSGQAGDSELNVRRYVFDEKTDRCYAQSWDEIKKGVQDLIANAAKLKTVVFDELGVMERRCGEYLCAKHNWPAVSHLGYGKGEGVLHAEMRVLLKMIEDLRSKGVSIIFTLHASEAKTPNPKGPDYRRFAPALTSVAPDGFVRETFTGWCDAVLFLTPEVETSTIGEDTKKKTIGVGTGKRLLFTQERGWFYAKCRFKNVESELEVPIDHPLRDFKRQMAEGQSVEGMTVKVRQLATMVDPELGKKTQEWLKTDAAKDLGALLNMSVFLSDKVPRDSTSVSAA